jgi:hypothetical protein
MESRPSTPYKRVSLWGFWVASVGFLIAAIVPVFQGESFKATFFVLAVVFAIFGLNFARRNRNSTKPPPAA